MKKRDQCSRLSLILYCILLLESVAIAQEKKYPEALGNKTSSTTVLQALQNNNCINAGFELNNFINWTGSCGIVQPAGSYSVISNAIVSNAGNNAGLRDSANYHTIMTVPPIQAVYPNTVGYDSMAVEKVGDVLMSRIPVQNPYGREASARMNGAVADKRACRLKYKMALNPLNKRLSYSYAIVLQDGGLNPLEQAYFKIRITDQNGDSISGTCIGKNYSTNATSARTDTSFRRSALSQDLPDPIYYRPWRTYFIDLSTAAFAAITEVNIEFEVAGSANGKQWGYAYVGAACGFGGTSIHLCSTNAPALLEAPPGYTTYQWISPSGIPIPDPQGTNDSLFTNVLTPGDVYTVTMKGSNNCEVSLTTTMTITPIKLMSIGSDPSCPEGHSGAVSVTPEGSNLGYKYVWKNASGAVVGTQQTVNGLPPGIYSVAVTSNVCNGVATGTVEVKAVPFSAYTIYRSLCDNKAFIAADPGGINYQWYHLAGPSSTLVPSPAGTKDTLFMKQLKPGDVYSVVYTDQQGCRDSIRYHLKNGYGDVYISNLQGICKDSTSGSVTLNFYSSESGPRKYQVNGPKGYSVQNAWPGNSQGLSGLTKGTYTVIAKDALCTYTTSFTVPSVVNFTVNPHGDPVHCEPGPAVADLNFAPVQAASCYTTGLSAPVANPYQLSPPSATSNGTMTLPGPYANSYHYNRQQYLVQKADLNAMGIQPGIMASLAFKVKSLNGDTARYKNFKIRLACTALNALANNTFETNGLNEVYFKDSLTISSGWNTYVFQKKFFWNGTDNLLVDICLGSPDSTTRNASVELIKKSYHASNWNTNNNVALCDTALATNGNSFSPLATQYLPSMRFGFGKVGDEKTYVITATPGPYTLSADHKQITFPGLPGPLKGVTQKQYTVTVTDNNGCVRDTVVSFVYAEPNTKAAVTKDSPACSGVPFNLSASNANGYTWFQKVGTNPLFLGNSPTVSLTRPPGTYLFYVLSSAYCRPDEVDSVQVLVYPSVTPTISINTDGLKCQGQNSTVSVQISPTEPPVPGSSFTYLWTDQNGNPLPGTNNQLSYFMDKPEGTLAYVLKVNGPCVNTLFEGITVNIDPCELKIPNVITPNGDGNNDRFIIKGLEQFPANQLTIFDRWGRKVYETNNYQNDWSAAGKSDGTFYYVLKIPDSIRNYQGFLTVFHGE